MHKHLLALQMLKTAYFCIKYIQADTAADSSKECMHHRDDLPPEVAPIAATSATAWDEAEHHCGRDMTLLLAG